MQIVSYEDKKHVTTEQYYKNNAFAVNMVKSKYPNGDESIVDVFNRIVTNLIQFEEDKSMQDTWFSILYDDWFRPGGSIMSCIGSNRKESLLNCTTLPVEGDTLEDISHTEHCLMKCAASRQGMGVDLSPLRPNGSLVNNAAEYSMGIIPWAKKYNRIGQYVGQRGRMPALLLSLSVSHPDIEEFIKSKIDLGEIEFANISVQVTNSFMDALKNKEMWTLEFTANRETISRDVEAEYLMQLIAETANQSAEPGVQFIDLMRQGSMVHVVYEKTFDEKYKIISTNACLPGDVLIQTNEGEVQLIDIINDIDKYQVVSYNEDEKKTEYDNVVFGDKTRESTSLVELELENGAKLELTPDHEVYTENRGYVEAADLNKDDIIYYLE